MSDGKKWFFTILYLVLISHLWLPRAESQHQLKSSSDASSASKAEHTTAYPSMPGPGKKVSIGKFDLKKVPGRRFLTDPELFWHGGEEGMARRLCLRRDVASEQAATFVYLRGWWCNFHWRR